MIAAAAVFAVAFLACLRFGSGGIRASILLAIVVAPLRGGLLDIFGDLPVGDPDIFVNALGPVLIAAPALALLIRRVLDPRRLPAALAYIWAALAVVCFFDLATQDTGLKLYAIGLVQYLAYPTMAVVLWFEIRDGEEQRLADLLLALGLLVCLTLYIQAAGIVDFVQAVPATVPGLPANRWAGITGSYLHTSALLGPMAVLALGLTLRGPGGRDWRWPALSFVALTIVLSSQILTFSRSGVVISAVGALVLVAFSTGPQRLRLVGVAIPALVISLLIGTLGGTNPSESAGRIGSGFKFQPTQNGGDAGNQQRTDAMKAAVRRYRDTTLPKKVFGEGIGSTGNARKLINEDPVPVESQYLKILVETGAFGVLLLVPWLIWATLAFLWRAVRATDPTERIIGAAGFAFSLHFVIFPTLEVQALATAWWVLLLLLLRTGPRPREARLYIGPVRAKIAARRASRAGSARSAGA